MEPAALRRIALVAIGLTLVAAIVTAALGFVLATSYRPWTAESWTLPAGGERDLDWQRWHGWAIATFVLASLITTVVVIWSGGTGDRRRSLLAAPPIALLAAVLTAITRTLVEWDQLALHSVTVGDDVDGYWTAAFSGDVRFMIVDGTEIAQGEYARSMALHLGAPVVGAALVLVVLAIALVRRRPTLADEADGTACTPRTIGAR